MVPGMHVTSVKKVHKKQVLSALSKNVAWIMCGLLHRGWLVLAWLVAGAPGGETASLKEQPDGVSLFCGVSHSHVG